MIRRRIVTDLVRRPLLALVLSAVTATAAWGQAPPV
jgi:hypothetical protein